MANPRLAGRYGKSLIDLAIEKNQLDAVYADMQYMHYICENSREFVTIMKSPVIKGDKKEKILDALTDGKVGLLCSSFSKLLVRKGREGYLPEIVEAFIQQYKDHNKIYTVKMTTAAPASEELKESILQKIRANTDMQKIELHTAVDEKIIGGFILEVGDRLVDASILFNLNNVKKQFQNNDFIFKLR